MYSRKVIDRRLNKLESKWGFAPVYHTTQEVTSAIAHINTFLNEDGDLMKPLGPDEQKWIQNENGICQIDFRYFYTRYATVMHWDGHSIVHQPKMSVAQNMLVDIWGENEELKIAIAHQILKARQLYSSTTIIHAILHRVNFWPDVNALIASSDPDKSTKLATMAELTYNHMPFWMQAQLTAPSRIGISMTFGNQNSAISIQHGNQFSGIARGTTPGVVMVSELPDWSDPENMIDAALLKAMHPSPWMFFQEESTAAEMGDWWHETWTANVEGWPNHKTIIRPVFLPWYIGTDIYPSEADRAVRPVSEGWHPLDITYKHAERCAADVKASDYLTKYLGKNWKMPKEQMWYWECEYIAAKKKKGLAQFYSELCANANDAFQSKSISVFDIDTITIYQEFRNPPKAVYGFEGIDISDRLKPVAHEIDTEKPPLEIYPAWNIQHPTNPVRLVPLKWQGDSEDDGLDKLYIWHWPDPACIYGLGVDLGDGIGLDRTVVEIIRKISFRERAAQCAEFASGYINSLDLWPISLAIGTLYSVHRDGEFHQPKAVIECRGNGDNTQLQMKLRGWMKFHLWTRLDNRKATAHLQSQKIGWYTNVWSRAQMMDWVVKFLRDELIEINSPWFIKEMRTLSRDESRQSFRAERGYHDDRITTMAQLLHSLHSFELTETDPSIAFDRIKRMYRGRPDVPLAKRVQETVIQAPEGVWTPEPAETDEFDPSRLPQE